MKILQNIIGHAKSKNRNRTTAKPVPLPNLLDHQITVRYVNSSKDSEHNHEPKAIRIGIATALSVMKDHVCTKN
jgi:hypothetical protein